MLFCILMTMIQSFFISYLGMLKEGVVLQSSYPDFKTLFADTCVIVTRPASIWDLPLPSLLTINNTHSMKFFTSLQWVWQIFSMSYLCPTWIPRQTRNCSRASLMLYQYSITEAKTVVGGSSLFLIQSEDKGKLRCWWNWLSDIVAAWFPCFSCWARFKIYLSSSQAIKKGSAKISLHFWFDALETFW